MPITGAQYPRGGKTIKVRLLQQNDHVGGKPISRWITDWWNWTLSSGIDGNQDDDVFFLRINPKPGESDSPFRAEFTSSATALKSQAILFPCLNTMIDVGTFPSEDTHTKRLGTAKNENNASPLGRVRCTIDTHDILGGNNLREIRMASDEFDLEATETPLVLMDFPVPLGVHRAATDGYFICIERGSLPPDRQPYTIRIHAQGVGGYVVNLLYFLFIANTENDLFDFQLKPKIDELIKNNTMTLAQARKNFPNVF